MENGDMFIPEVLMTAKAMGNSMPVSPFDHHYAHDETGC